METLIANSFGNELEARISEAGASQPAGKETNKKEPAVCFGMARLVLAREFSRFHDSTTTTEARSPRNRLDVA